MNNICREQNKEEQLNMLAAQRYLYSSAKKLFQGRFWVAIFFAVLGPLLFSTDVWFAPYFGLFSLVYFLTDLFFLKRIEYNKRMEAAKIQELFDTVVLNLNWNQIVVGRRPILEKIFEASECFKKHSCYKDLKNWYPVSVCKLNIPLARILCQRTNIWWDSKLRRVFAYGLISFILVITLLVFLVALIMNMTIDKIILSLLLPVLPLYKVVLGQIVSQLKTAEDVECLREKADKIIEDSLSLVDLDPQNTKSRCRTLQDEIFRHRRSSMPVPDRIYSKLMFKYETQMVFNADAKVKEAISRGLTDKDLP